MADRLHRIDETLFPFANTSAHPRELEDKAEFREAKALLRAPEVPLERVLRYVQGANWLLACAALSALAERDDRQDALDAVMMQIDRLAAWALQFALDFVLALDERPPVGAPLLGANDNWRDHPVIPAMLREHLDGRRALGDAAAFGPDLAATPPWRVQVVRTLLETLRHPLADALLAELGTAPAGNAEGGHLASVGRFWDVSDGGDLVEPDDWREPLASAAAQLAAGTAPSTLVVGDTLVGKTSYLKRLALHASAHGIRVFEAGASDLMAGQQWFGQLEERIRKTVDELASDKKIVWYVPDLLQLARSGSSQVQSASLLDQILPAIASRRVIVWAEASPTIAARLFQARPLLRGLLEQVSIEAPSDAGATALAQRVVEGLAARAGLTLAPEAVPLAIDAAKQYLGAASLPGSAIQLLRLAAKEAADGDARLGSDAIYRVLAQLSGLPQTILDARAPIDLADARAFFAQRVIGQDEAVTAIVERIAMLKAGLNDPGKPIGVFLFAGPTGTGKTELAKATAEYLFGSAERMIRLDMSEFQMPESIGKLIGDNYLSADAETLVNRVRKQPFSVILLDEFEKSHNRIWDLFLQVFDEGRLSDVSGQLADFRHALIILTSNLGATSHQGSGLGFAPSAGAFSDEQVMRAIAQTYRPEFQNRLDRVIVFKPLTRELMRKILKKELDRVLARRGLKDRSWAVEFESTALDFLLEKGFSPEMGARPLKRAIDRFLLAPLAATIVERRFPEGDQFVFVRSDGRAIQAEFVDPDLETTAAPPVEPAPGGEDASLPDMILAPGGTLAEALALGRRLAELRAVLEGPDVLSRKDRLAEAMAAPGFWQDDARFETLARFALLDRVAAAAQTATALTDRLERGRRASARVSRELVARSALQLHLVGQGLADIVEEAPIEVVLLIEPALDAGSTSSDALGRWCGELFAMYSGWCKRRHMQFEELARGPNELPFLLVSGFGAYRTLTREVGLHVLEEGEVSGTTRQAARVRLAVAPLGDVSKSRLARSMADRFTAETRPGEVVRRYRRSPSPLVREPRHGWRSGRLDAVLKGDFDLLALQRSEEGLRRTDA